MWPRVIRNRTESVDRLIHLPYIVRAESGARSLRDRSHPPDRTRQAHPAARRLDPFFD